MSLCTPHIAVVNAKWHMELSGSQSQWAFSVFGAQRRTPDLVFGHVLYIVEENGTAWYIRRDSVWLTAFEWRAFEFVNVVSGKHAVTAST